MSGAFRAAAMPAYVVALIESIHDAETYKSYVAQVAPTLAPFGGRFIARKPEPELLEGSGAPSRAVVLEFPDEARARAWHASAPYQPVMRLRQSASKGKLLLLPGYGEAQAREGDVHYVEHVTGDVEATRAVLEATHGWHFAPPDAALGGSRVAVLPSGARCGIRAPLRDDEAPVTRAYVRVRDVRAAAAQAEESGALVALPPIELGPHGWIAIFILGGVEHGLWQLP